MQKLAIALLVSALAVTSLPASAVDLPDYGSKNFNASDDTPTHFANENVPVSARTADTTERDWSVVDAMAPARPAGSRRWARRGSHQARYSFAHGSGRHFLHAASSGARFVPVHAPASSGRATTARHGKFGGRHASAVAGTAMM